MTEKRRFVIETAIAVVGTMVGMKPDLMRDMVKMDDPELRGQLDTLINRLAAVSEARESGDLTEGEFQEALADEIDHLAAREIREREADMVEVTT